MAEQKTPWKTLSEKKIYENQWIELTEYQVINPTVRRHIWESIIQREAVGIIPLMKKEIHG